MTAFTKKNMLHLPFRSSLMFRGCVFILLLTACQPEKQESQPVPAVPPEGHGHLEGFVRLAENTLPRPTRIENTTDPQACGKMQTLEDLLVSDNTHGIQNVIVALKDVPPSKTPPPRPGSLILDNRQCRFVPHVSVLTAGSSIHAINSDSILHNAHFYGAVTANIALPRKGVKATKRVDEPGMVIVKCDVHGWMQAFIRVDRHPFHAVTDENGHFRIPDIPAGTYDLEIWHEKLGVLDKTVEIESTKVKKIEVAYLLNNN